jgi:type I restriction enzyme, S subunit
LTQRTLNGVTVILPPLPEQRRIAAYLDERRAGFDALAGNLRRQVETLEQYRRSLIHECVTGKRRCA